jgi:hypothetical protein
MHHRQHVYRKGFALPTVLIASVILLSVLAVAVSATSAIRTTLKNQYYAQLAQIAGESGVAYAKACLAANGNVPQWTDAKPLKPSTDCFGNPLLGSSVRSLVVAGGGSGGGSTGGGGGAGGLIATDSSTVTATTYPVVVGAGGVAAAFGNNTGNDGANSSFNGIVAIGGGGGGHSASGIPGTGGHNGGSGGGGQKYYSNFNPGTGTLGQGFDGGPLGTGATSTTGGGGAGGVGTGSTVSSGGGNGGPGLQSDITGASLYYAAGGGGGGASGLGGVGGSGLGGNGSTTGTNAGTAGTVNTGSGGGGGWSHTSGGSGAGGSGVVIISYPTNSGITATGGTVTTAGLYKVHKFTSNGDFVVTAAGTASCPGDTRCSVSVSGNIRSSFSVNRPTLDSQGKAVTIPYNGYVEILRTSNGSVWRTITQPSVQAAVVPDLCSGVTESALGWSTAVRASTQDSLDGAPAAQSITIANTTLNAGAAYYRRDVSVSTAGTYNVKLLSPSSQDIAELYVGAQKVATSAGALASGTVSLSPGCQVMMVKVTNATVDPRTSRFIASMQKSDAASPIAVTDPGWRVATGDTVHYSSPNYYASPSNWVAVRDFNNPAYSGNLAARGITTPMTPASGYAYFRDNRTINVSTTTPINGTYACTGGCILYLDGEIISTGVASISNTFNTTLQPGDHRFAMRLLYTTTSTNFYFTAFRDSDGAVLSQSDPNWSTTNTWTTAQDYYSYDASYVPTPSQIPTGLVSALIVGGGGGGGTGMGGGGGGGGVVYNAAYTVFGSADVVVGSGGTGAVAGLGVARGLNGGDSQLDRQIAFGGGGGGTQYSTNNYPPGSGASAGGNAAYLQTTPARGILGQGNNATILATPYYPSGGGGAGGVGGVNPGHGGIGVFNDILGPPGYYWGGGGGGSGYTGIGGNGGNGGGGGGAVGTTTGGAGLNPGSPGGGGTTVAQTNKPGGNAGANTGGGGGGGAHYNATNAGGNGGSGIVIISYPTGSMTAIGGSISTVGSNTVHTFTSSGTFTVVPTYAPVDVLLVGGGGGGGNNHAGGGGGGGVVATSAVPVSVQSYGVTVGAGGSGGTGTGTPGGIGGSSFFNGIAAVGGGGGGGRITTTSVSQSSVGGSGGGGAGTIDPTTGVAGAGKPGIAGQGNAGGNGTSNATAGNGGGGGGAGVAGGNATGAGGSGIGASGTGGNGLINTISGSSVYYGGGGSGGRWGAGTVGAAGLGGGGTGGALGTVGTAGTANTGGGGGGGGDGGSNGGAGGSGIVIISYPTGSLVATGGTITTVGTNTVHTFTSSGTFTVWSIE